jgi:hypothetical protein
MGTVAPDTFVGLGGSPANVARQDVMMLATTLMSDRETYKSELRSEMMLALYLESLVNDYQSQVQNKLNGLDESDEENK